MNNENRTNPQAKARSICRAVFGIENCRAEARGSKLTIFNKKAQITAFIIVGLVLVIAAGIAVYFISMQAKAPVEEAKERVIATVPSDFMPVRAFVESCIEKISTDAFIKLGQHGGYIDPSDAELSGKTFSLENAISNPTEADAVSFSSNNLDPIVYWWLLRTSNQCSSCSLESLAPSFGEVEGQLNRYVNKNLNSCLQDFTSLKTLGFDFKLTNIKTETTIARNNVVVYVEYPMDVTLNNVTQNIKQFQTKLDLDFAKIFDLSAAVMLHEINTQVLEGITLQLISDNAAVDFNKLPPIFALTKDYYTVTWQKSAVKEKIKNNLLIPYTFKIRVDKTKNAVHLACGEYEQGLCDRMLLNVFNGTYPNVSIDFYYLGWPYYFAITPPVNGETISPTVDKGSWPIGESPQTNTYEEFYDLSYPVVVTLKDDEAFNKKGYTMRFAFELNIRDNRDLLQWFLGNGTIGAWDFSRVNYSVEGVPSTYPSTDPTTGQTTQVSSNVTAETLRPAAEIIACRPSQKVSGLINVKVYNGTNSAVAMDGVSLSYGCGDYFKCPLEQTKKGLQNKSYFEDRLPVCANGYLELEKEGFIKKVISLSSLPNIGQNITVYMDSFRSFDVEVKKKLVDGTGIGQAQSLSSDELLILSINKVKQDVFDQELQQVVIVDISNATVTADTQQIRLVPGKYEVTATYLDKRGFIIPKECKHICECWHCLCVDEKIPDRDINVTPAPLGGLYLNNNTGSWYVNSWNLYNKENLEMYIITVPKPPCVDEMEDLGRIEEYSETYRSAVEPKFS